MAVVKALALMISSGVGCEDGDDDGWELGQELGWVVGC